MIVRPLYQVRDALGLKNNDALWLVLMAMEHYQVYMESVGRASGLVKGYAAARANTPQGKAAYQLAQAGSIDILTQCDRPGWRIEKSGCYPDQGPGGKLTGSPVICGGGPTKSTGNARKIGRLPLPASLADP
jgi:hypothetical protein